MVRDKKRQILWGLAVLFIITMVLTIFFTRYIITVTNNLKNDIGIYLSEVSQQSALSLKNEVNNEVNSLKDFAEVLGKDSSVDVKKTVELLNVLASKKGVKRMGLILPNGEVYTTDGLNTDTQDMPLLKKSMVEWSVISDIVEDNKGDGKINVISTPIYNNDKVIGYIFATHRLEAYKNILSVSTFGGQGYSYVIKSNGETIVPSTHKDSVKNFDFYRLINNDIKEIEGSNKEKVIEDIKSGRSGGSSYTYNGIEKYMNYTPIGINDWCLLSVIPGSIVTDKVDYVKNNAIFLCFGSVLVFALLLSYIIFGNEKTKDMLYKSAFLDMLTGLRNIIKFKIDAEKILKKEVGSKYAIVYFDIEKFKYINDRLGYNNGSKVLRYVADIFKGNLKDKEILCRVSADKFIAMLRYEENSDELEKKHILKRIKKINAEAGRFLDDNGTVIEIVFSVGIYRIQENPKKDYFNINAIIDKGDVARKHSKGYHETTYSFYSDVDESKILMEKEMEDDMYTALANNEFMVYLQPKYSLKNFKIVGAEALIRWHHPEKGFISPGEFIPLFEKNGFIDKIDIYVFESVCKILRKWIDEDMNIIPISVNVSRGHLSSRGFVDKYKKIISKYNVPTNYIEIEITESAVIDSVQTLIYVIEGIKELGFTISMDDFGSGYSSLNVLRNIPVDVLKLDREFFDEITDNERWKKVVLGVVSLAKSMDIKVVSEGVETEEQSEFLREIGCDMAQGYLFAKPMPVGEFEEVLRKSID